jgi:predicted transposase YdaD
MHKRRKSEQLSMQTIIFYKCTIKHRGAIREITEKSEGVNTIKHRGVVREITEKGVQYGNHRGLNI